VKHTDDHKITRFSRSDQDAIKKRSILNQTAIKNRSRIIKHLKVVAECLSEVEEAVDALDALPVDSNEGAGHRRLHVED